MALRGCQDLQLGSQINQKQFLLPLQSAVGCLRFQNQLAILTRKPVDGYQAIYLTHWFTILGADDLNDLGIMTNGSIENEALARVRINLILQAILKERRPLAPPTKQTQRMGLGFETPLTTLFTSKQPYTAAQSPHTINRVDIVSVSSLLRFPRLVWWMTLRAFFKEVPKDQDHGKSKQSTSRKLHSRLTRGPIQ